MRKALLALSVLLAVSSAQADLGECQSADILDASLISDVPWSAMYPIRLAGVNLSPTGSGAPDDAVSKAMCSCQNDLGVYVPGFTQAMYEPARLIETVRMPDCMMSLNGTTLSMTNGRAFGSPGHNQQEEGASTAYWQYHYFAYPLLLMLEMISTNRCSDGYLSMDLLYFSELDPTWNDPELAFFANPEAAIFANPVSIAACIADNAAAAVGKPIDSLYWCAGAWGGLYPLSGYVSNKSSNASKTSLLATRAVAALHRRLLAWQTMGEDNLCQANLFPTIPKSQYKMNMMYPVVERGGSQTITKQDLSGGVSSTTYSTGNAHEIGEPAMIWGEWRNVPSEEDAVYMLWRWNDCCQTYY